MTLLGKIFTVLILVMSVLFMGFAIMVYATHTNWKAKVEELRPQLAQLKQVNEQLRLERERVEKDLAMEQAARRYALAALQTKLAQADLQRQASEAALANQQAAHSAAVEMLRSTQNRLAQLTEETDRLRSDLTSAWRDRDEQFAKVVELTDKLNWAQGEMRLLTERRDQLAMQVSRQKKVLDSFGLSEFTPTDDMPPPNVDGVVIAVSEKDLVEISLGSDDGLRVGHQLDVYRDRFYLGRIVVRKTMPDRAVAEILKEYRKGLIKKGDSVATKLI